MTARSEAEKLAEEVKRLASEFATVYGRLHFARQCGGPVNKVGEETEAARCLLHAAIDRLATPLQGAEEDRIRRLQDAIEGECDGMAIGPEHARAILEWVDNIGDSHD